jgi:pimeloyl-ACP methyl ester carboxylesterase
VARTYIGGRRQSFVQIEFAAPGAAAPGVDARDFRASAGGRAIPGTLWAPTAGPRESRPVVLLQHGGSGHRRDTATTAAAIRLAQDQAFCCAAIDGPLHGERRSEVAQGANVQAEFAQAWQRGGGLASFVEDWLAVIDGLSALPDLDHERIGWFGLSMGTAFGASVLARCPTIASAVLGKWSVNFPGSQHLRADAGRIRCPVLFVQHWNDEFFDRAGALELFDALGSVDKRLHAYPGAHAGRSEEELVACIAHLSNTLRPKS